MAERTIGLEVRSKAARNDVVRTVLFLNLARTAPGLPHYPMSKVIERCWGRWLMWNAGGPRIFPPNVAITARTQGMGIRENNRNGGGVRNSESRSVIFQEHAGVERAEWGRPVHTHGVFEGRVVSWERCRANENVSEKQGEIRMKAYVKCDIRGTLHQEGSKEDVCDEGGECKKAAEQAESVLETG